MYLGKQFVIVVHLVLTRFVKQCFKETFEKATLSMALPHKKLALGLNILVNAENLMSYYVYVSPRLYFALFDDYTNNFNICQRSKRICPKFINSPCH